MTTATIEALATGLPVIATRHSGFPDQVDHGVNGYLVEEANPKELADRILEFIEHPEWWPAMSRASRQIALGKYDRTPLINRQCELYESIALGAKQIAFFVGVFPAISETWLINQIADLLDRGIDVRIYAFRRGEEEHVSDRFFSYRMSERTTYLAMPESLVSRIFFAIPKLARLAVSSPRALFAVLNTKRFGRNALSLKMLYWTAPVIGLKADIVHCHFGTVANRVLALREVLGMTQPLLTSFYGLDVSHIPHVKGNTYYDRLKSACDHFIVMSNNMKERVVALGFDGKKITVLPISVEVGAYPYRERSLDEERPVRMLSVGRFVEKKGFDDLLQAIALVRGRTMRKFELTIVGGGELDGELQGLTKRLELTSVVHFAGYMKVQDIVELSLASDLYLQPSKTAKNGDME